jgi:hypothetical protein
MFSLKSLKSWEIKVRSSGHTLWDHTVLKQPGVSQAGIFMAVYKGHTCG